MPDRRVLVCFDYEGRWGMPYRAPYDVEAGTQAILDCLDRHQARAVFFTVGALAVEMGPLIAAIYARGHEIGLHGWCHEDLTRLTARRKRFTAGLAEGAAAVQAVTGNRPTGYRAPYLLAPSFFDQELHRWLAGRGYRYTSNREIRACGGAGQARSTPDPSPPAPAAGPAVRAGQRAQPDGVSRTQRTRAGI